MKKRILFLIDAQNDFCEEGGALSTREAIKAVDNIVEFIGSGKFDRIVLTFDSHDERYGQTQEGRRLPISHCVVGTKGFALNKKINNAIMDFISSVDETVADNFPGEISEYACRYTRPVYKESFVHPYFLHKAVDDVISSFGDDISEDDIEFVVCGFCTDICVISNVLTLKGFYPEAAITVLSDCCAGTTPEMHESALKVMKSCMADIVESNCQTK